ncbi:class Ib ribonucleoside-diphosphate reductase assembly flavoprotein NrdI [Streptococcus danieliae]|uniref:Class Ib ribonucleoside-diphosphate reductase assembly flavoprotein NrdI n=1 Tax=Streptococcus danieliae TaxID=747656 RepID=A0A7X3GA68_9STRE|nr:class Ib ribonucleoside-diphosphate reductase assembly flavoprotein NrdI [Streptococcus danieliae]MBF0845017.1 class Ib ribonucleoside-diphosphate reductase assembly flavoprotein NrdI [Streptococcus danieliae]MVX59044.1 class Ib ribonucleoside-diphosphate reductase assembly flavoprotein NrdI [Streptococcus danieliae]
MQEMTFVYISLSGNTESFVSRLQTYLLIQNPSLTIHLIDIKSLVKEEQDFFFLNKPYVTFVPTYLEGGNGIDNGDVEILTTDVRDFMAYGENAFYCLGVVGSGNRNFNHQYCLTAQQYSQQFSIPVLDTFEMRGMQNDVERIAHKILEAYAAIYE